MDELAGYLSGHAFRELFVDYLGWERASGSHTATVDDLQFSFEVIAHKRGFQVLYCSTNRRTLFNRGRLRRLQKRMARLIHEHVLIYSCEEPRRKQVWQWAIRTSDGRIRGHREHAFFSPEPPPPLLRRLGKLQFTLDEEESATLVDAMQRIRQALDVKAELNLFVRRPSYAEQSDELVKAMKAGAPEAFEKFVEFHRPLARHFSKRLCRLFGLELEEAEHIGMIGVMKAARRFEPERGLQFSTSATYWVRAFGQRLGPEAGLLIHVPQHVLWPCIRLRHTLERLQASHEPPQVRWQFDEMLNQEFGSTKPWIRFLRATNIASLSDRRQPGYGEARRMVDPGGEPSRLVLRADQAGKIRDAIDQLHPRYAEVIRLRYGIAAAPLTLEEVGHHLRVTRERVRQIQAKAEQRLVVLIRNILKDDIADWLDDENHEPANPGDEGEAEAISMLDQ